MRNISFALTTRQIRDGSKTVTRRIGWAFLKPGDRLMACVKCQGLGKGGKIEKIREIEVVSVKEEVLMDIVYVHDAEETAREGFPGMSPRAFMRMFCEHMNCDDDRLVTRIGFKYVPAALVAAQVAGEAAKGREGEAGK